MSSESESGMVGKLNKTIGKFPAKMIFYRKIFSMTSSHFSFLCKIERFFMFCVIKLSRIRELNWNANICFFLMTLIICVMVADAISFSGIEYFFLNIYYTFFLELFYWEIYFNFYRLWLTSAAL